jgi:uncharacterized repeat protein (TIGR01451 family)
LINAGFEEPVLPPNGAPIPPGWFYYGSAWGIPADQVPGWDTTDPSGIQLFTQYGTTTAHSGTQFAETNHIVPAKLFQSVDTSAYQGLELTWSFAHHAIAAGAPEIVRLEIGPTGGATNFTYESTVVHADGWVVRTGTYLVPVGQTSTEFGWQAVQAPSPNAGNLLDTIQFGVEECTPELTLEKTSDVTDPATLVAGDEITYSFEVTNTGNIPLTNVTVTDPLEGLSAITPATVPDLAVDASETFTATYTVTQADIDAGQILNTATATADEPEGCDCGPPTDTDDYVITIPRTAATTVEKTADPTEDLVLGDTVTYTFVVTNTGNVTLTDVTVTDELAGLSAIDPPSVASLAPDATATFTATYVVTQADVDAGEIVNSATATGTPPPSCTSCPPPVSPPVELTVVIPQTPDYSIVKTADPATGVNEGDTITYTFVVTNTGNVTLTNFTLVDPLPGLTWVTGPNLGTIAVGDTATGEATYVVTAEDIVNGGVTNSVAGTCDEGCDPAPCPPGEACEVTVIPGDPGLTISKVADPAEGVVEGDTITYTFTATNTGEITHHDVTLVDILPGLTWIDGPNLGTILPGDSATGSASYTVTAEDIANGGVTNTATATCSPACDPPPVTVIVLPGLPNVTFAKTADTAGPVNAGDVITYTFTATNTGNATAPNVVIADELAGLEWVTGPELGDIAAGGSAEGSATYTVTEADVVAGGVTNAATITCDRGCEEVPPVEVFVPGGDPPPPGGLTVEKTSDATGEEVHPGDLITYAFTVTNTGGTPVENVTVTDPLPGLSAIEGPHGTTLAPGESAVFTATYPVTEADADAGTIVNTATATGTDATGTSVGDDDSITLTACDPDGSVDPTPTPGPGTPEADDLELDEESQFEGAAVCDGTVVPNPTDPPVDPQPTRPSGGNNGGGGGGGPITQLPSTGQAESGNAAFTTILPLGALLLLAMTIAFAQRRKAGGRQD